MVIFIIQDGDYDIMTTLAKFDHASSEDLGRVEKDQVCKGETFLCSGG